METNSSCVSVPTSLSPGSTSCPPGDVITGVQWLRSRDSDELIAIVARGHFVTMHAFGNRVEQVNNAGIVMEKAAVSDTGNYTVEVEGYDASGVYFILFQTVMVHISGKSCRVLSWSDC